MSSGRLTEADAATAKARIATGTELSEVAPSADHVIETVVEDLDAKRQVLARLDEACRDDVVIASGLDTTLRVADAMREQYGERFLAPQNLRSLVSGGHLGRKTGRGFSDYGSAT